MPLDTPEELRLWWEGSDVAGGNVAANVETGNSGVFVGDPVVAAVVKYIGIICRNDT